MEEKGAQMPSVQNSDNLADSIRSIKSLNEYPIPSGVIVMYHGSTSDIPEDWHLCDGSNGTPNLKDKFVVTGKSHSSSGIDLVVEESYSLAYIMKL